MIYQRKTKDVYAIESFWVGEWCEVCEEDTQREALKRLKEYRENEPHNAHRIRKHREPIAPPN